NQTTKIMMAQYHNIIWDWNGTLLNDLDLSLKIANGMLANHQTYMLDLATYQNAFGFPITAYYEKIGIDLSKESFEVLTDRFVTNYNAGLLDCQLHDGALTILQEWQKQQKKQYILTAAHLDLVTPLLNKFDIEHFFEHVEGVDNFKAEGKAARGVRMLQEQQIKPAETVLIGDTYHDYEVANTMGVACILVANGHQSKERLVDFTQGTTKVIGSLKELWS
ncbi:MAG: HAD hydrolase-like protein, partial [Bacteroidota bacterium]